MAHAAAAIAIMQIMRLRFMQIMHIMHCLDGKVMSCHIYYYCLCFGPQLRELSK
jgi:hypothetical protein